MPVLPVSGSRLGLLLPMKIAQVDFSRPAQAVATAVMASGYAAAWNGISTLPSSLPWEHLSRRGAVRPALFQGWIQAQLSQPIDSQLTSRPEQRTITGGVI